MSAIMESWPRRHRITVEEYYRMAEVGLLAPDARVELIEGVIIDMPPIGMDHGGAVDQLTRLFVMAAGEQAIVRVQGAVRLSRYSEPMPDLALLKPRDDFYRRTGHPSGTEALLIVEVSDSTLRYDREVKAPLYARHGVPELWIVDLKSQLFHFFRSPTEQGYAEISSIAQPGLTPLVALPGLAIDLSRFW